MARRSCGAEMGTFGDKSVSALCMKQRLLGIARGEVRREHGGAAVGSVPAQNQPLALQEPCRAGQGQGWAGTLRERLGKREKLLSQIPAWPKVLLRCP